MPNLVAARRWVEGVVPRTCAGCRGPGGPLCPACRATLRRAARQAEVRPRPPGLPPVWAVTAYAGPAREALVAFKDHGRWSLRRALGEAIAGSAAAALLSGTVASGVVLVPAPGSPGSVRARDGDHVRELADVAARVLRARGVDVEVVMALASIRRRHDQVGLGRADRAANLGSSMAPTVLARGLRGGRAVVLLDDLVTSGATLAEAARALRTVGVEPLGAAVVASTSRRC